MIARMLLHDLNVGQTEADIKATIKMLNIVEQQG